MGSLNNVVILWSMIAAIALLLAIVHAARWVADRRAWADLAIVVLAISFVGIAIAELRAMNAGNPEEWGRWMRLIHYPIFGLYAGVIAFIHFYLGAARPWLAGSLIGIRIAILALNFTSPVSFNFQQVISISQVRFLGESVTVAGEVVTGRWQFLGLVSSLLLMAFVLDAATTLWRRGQVDDRRKAVVIAGSLLIFIVAGSANAQFVIFQVTQFPVVLTLTFLLPLLAMSFELVRDMLRASRLARELLESQRLLELAASAADLGLCEWNSGTRRLWATRQAHDIFGLAPSPPNADVRDWLLRIHPDDLPSVEREMEQALSSGSDYVIEFRVCLPAGGTRWVSARGRTELSEPDRRVVVRGVVRDVSALRREQHESQALRSELAHAGRVSMLGQLASSLAHELSQPLGAILRNVEVAELLLEDSRLDVEELKAIVRDIHRDDRRAGEVIDRLRMLLKRRQLDLQPITIDTLVSDVTALVRTDAASRHVVVRQAAEPGLPMVAADRVHLSQVLINLIINGMDAVMTRPVPERWVAVQGRRVSADAVELSVIDSGPGVANEVLPRVFEPFFTTKEKGMGMGLSISRAIVEAHGGRLTVENLPGGGAAFRMQLRAWQTAAA
jgi:signal transduction histidine kinase